MSSWSSEHHVSSQNSQQQCDSGNIGKSASKCAETWYGLWPYGSFISIILLARYGLWLGFLACLTRIDDLLVSKKTGCLAHASALFTLAVKLAAIIPETFRANIR